MATGSVTSGHDLSVFHGVIATPARIRPEVSSLSASSVPPPPIEWPATPRRLVSARERTALGADELTAQSSAARSWLPRLAGWSKIELVSMPTTTKPHEARRGPSQLRLDQRAV